MCVCVFVCGGERDLLTNTHSLRKSQIGREWERQRAGGSKRKTDGDKKESLFHVRERNCFQFCSKEHD